MVAAKVLPAARVEVKPQQGHSTRLALVAAHAWLVAAATLHLTVVVTFVCLAVPAAVASAVL